MSDLNSNTPIQPDAIGEDEKHRPQPIDESPILLESNDLIDMMERTLTQIEKDKLSRGDLKILNRTLRELRYAMKVFQPFRRRRKLSIFGSARTRPDHPTYIAAEELGRAMAGRGWMVITGAGGGIMEAGHKGAGREMSMGLNIMLPFEQSANEFILGDPKLVTFKYFFTRKLMFVKECSSVVCLPGGFGTIDETFEAITLLQTGKQTMLPLVLMDAPGGSFWKGMEQFVRDSLLSEGLISPEDVNLYRVTHSVEDTVEEVLRFYRVYHSMRYVDNNLVLRINHSLSEEKLDQLNTDFSSILVQGKVELCEALSAESNEPEIAHLPRLKLHFNRRNFGQLRQFIDSING
ncbi:MAG: TIGR00730 family Rossman fold protein [Pirellulaceae bacterium]|nr:TIGR00730 family Rossman fold protein [Pirellulaceae bacterium]